MRRAKEESIEEIIHRLRLQAWCCALEDSGRVQLPSSPRGYCTLCKVGDHQEANETSKWLEMLWKSEYIDEARYKALDRKCSTIRFLLVKSITTAKNNLKGERKKKNSIQCDLS